jgi:hypothetical protein
MTASPSSFCDALRAFLRDIERPSAQVAVDIDHPFLLRIADGLRHGGFRFRRPAVVAGPRQSCSATVLMDRRQTAAAIRNGPGAAMASTAAATRTVSIRTVATCAGRTLDLRCVIGDRTGIARTPNCKVLSRASIRTATTCAGRMLAPTAADAIADRTGIANPRTVPSRASRGIGRANAMSRENPLTAATRLKVSGPRASSTPGRTMADSSR